MNYTLGIQRALTPSLVLESAFVGTRGVKFVMVRTFKLVDRITGIRPNPGDIQGSYNDNSQQTNYNSWQRSLGNGSRADWASMFTTPGAKPCPIPVAISRRA